MINLKDLIFEALTFSDLFTKSTRSRIDRAKGVHGGSLDIKAGKDGDVFWLFKFRHNPGNGGSGWTHHGYIKFINQQEQEKGNKDPDDMECMVDCDCFSGNTLVLMSDGTYKPIQEIKIGDKVYTHKGRVKKVSDVMSRPSKPNENVYRMKVSGFPFEMIVTGNHPFYTLRGNDVCLCGCGKSLYFTENTKSLKQISNSWSPNCMLSKRYIKGHYRTTKYIEKSIDNSMGIFDWITVDNFRPKEWFLTPWIKNDSGKPFDTDLARLIGYYIAEGCIPHKTGTSIRLTFNLNEKHTLGRDVSNICEKIGLKFRTEDDKGKEGKFYGIRDSKIRQCFDLTINDKDVQTLCKTLVGEGCSTKKISNDVFNWNIDALKNVIAGVFLGDGNISDRGTIRYHSINFNLITQISTILNKIGIVNNISIGNNHTNDENRNICYQIGIPRGEPSEKMRIILSPYLREKDKISNTNKEIRKISYIRSDGHLKTMMKREKIDFNGTVYNLTVEEDNSYIVNGIAVHNCEDFRYRWAYANNLQGSSPVGVNSYSKNNGQPARVLNPHNQIGLCVAKGELVSTNRGFIPIENVEKNDLVWTLEGWNRVLESVHTGTKEIIEIKSQSGRIIKVTPEHKVLVFNEKKLFQWVQASSLTSKDFLCLTHPADIDKEYRTIQVDEYSGDKLHYPKRTIKMDPVLSELMGYMVSEGSPGLFSNFNDKLLRDFYDKWTTIFGNQSCVLRKDGCYIGPNGHKILSQIGFKTGAYNKDVPDWILSGNREIVVSFLRGCYAGDGNFRNRHSTYASVSEKLVRNIQLLSGFLGVKTSVSCGYGGVANSLVWTVRTSSQEQTEKLFSIVNPIRGYSSYDVKLPVQEHFSRDGYIVEKGNKFFTTLIENTLLCKIPNQEIILNNCSDYFNSIKSEDTYWIASSLKKLGLLRKCRIRKSGKMHNVAYTSDIFLVLKSYLVRKIKNKLGISHLGSYKIHRNKIVEILKELKEISPESFDPVSLLCKKDVHFEKIESVNRLKEVVDVYDLKIDNVEHFTVNGVVVHNCKHLIALRNFLKKHIDWEGLKRKAYQRTNNPVGFDPSKRPSRRPSSVGGQKPNIFEGNKPKITLPSVLDDLVNKSNGVQIPIDEYINEIYVHGFCQSDDKPGFHMPENYDDFDEGKGWVAYRGMNDWEQGITGVWIYIENHDEKIRIWFDVKYPEGYVVDSGDKGSTQNEKQVKGWGEKASTTWIKISKRLHSERDKSEPGTITNRDWEGCFIDALKDKEMVQFVKEFGVDHTKWSAMKPEKEDVNEQWLIKEGYFYNGDGWFIHEGESDRITVIFENGKKLWFDVGFGKNCRGVDRSKWREKAARKWAALAKDIHNNPELMENGNPIEKNWETCFREAYQNSELDVFKQKPKSIFNSKGSTPRI